MRHIELLILVAAVGAARQNFQFEMSPFPDQKDAENDQVEPIYMSGATANRQMANKIAKGWEVDPPYKYPFQVSISGKAVKDVI